MATGLDIDRDGRVVWRFFFVITETLWKACIDHIVGGVEKSWPEQRDGGQSEHTAMAAQNQDRCIPGTLRLR
jgi:hypothetical protein